MVYRSRLAAISLALLALPYAMAAEDGPDVGAHSASQAAADVIRTYAGSDGAFLAAGMLKKTYQKDNLASLLEYPSNTISVLSLTGSQIRVAFERSVALYPQPNAGFLQISGFEVTFKKNGSPNSKIVSIMAGGARLDDAKSYTVAMPSTLAQGGAGYFRIWENAKTVKTLEKQTVAQVLAGKHAVDTAPRWLPVS